MTANEILSQFPLIDIMTKIAIGWASILIVAILVMYRKGE